MTKEQIIKELNQCTKDEIITALIEQKLINKKDYDLLKSKLEFVKEIQEIKHKSKLEKDYEEKHQIYKSWLADIRAKYGENNYLLSLTKEELEYGIMIENNFIKSEKRYFKSI